MKILKTGVLLILLSVCWSCGRSFRRTERDENRVGHRRGDERRILFFLGQDCAEFQRRETGDPRQMPRLYEVMERLAAKANLPVPKLYVIPEAAPNAFATGRNPQHASVAVTEGLLQLMNDDELEGVIAHELSHVRNYDILTSSIAATIAGAITYLASMGRLAMIFGGFSGGTKMTANVAED